MSLSRGCAETCSTDGGVGSVSASIMVTDVMRLRRRTPPAPSSSFSKRRRNSATSTDSHIDSNGSATSLSSPSLPTGISSQGVGGKISGGAENWGSNVLYPETPPPTTARRITSCLRSLFESTTLAKAVPDLSKVRDVPLFVFEFLVTGAAKVLLVMLRSWRIFCCARSRCFCSASPLFLRCSATVVRRNSASSAAWSSSCSGDRKGPRLPRRRGRYDISPKVLSNTSPPPPLSSSYPSSSSSSCSANCASIISSSSPIVVVRRRCIAGRIEARGEAVSLSEGVLLRPSFVAIAIIDKASGRGWFKFF
eukprot:PhM_4_TR18858/c0_g1_i1/m.43504